VGFSAADHGVLETKKEYLYKRLKGRRRRIDIGYVGEITGIQNLPILRHLYAEKIPVIAPLGIGRDGHVYNINADIAACEIAGRLKAEKLIFITDVDGIYDRKKNLISSLTMREVERGIRRRVISGGMVPKSRSMIKALKRGVKKTHIINGKVPHALLLEIFTDKGIGTELVP
jgi:acetylglutamate kinase